jgi:PAS domain S-box-containing protein
MGKHADMVVFRDISKRKEVQLDLIKNEEKFRKFFENEPEYCYIVSPDGKILDINTSALNILGYKKEDIIGKPLIETIYTLSSQEKAKLLLKKWRETGSLRNEELKISTKTGKIRDILLSADSVRNSNGKIIHSISVQRDITEINNAKKSLQESERRYKDLFDLSPDGIITINKKGFINSCNTAFLNLTGFNENEIVGKHYLNLPTLIIKSLPNYVKVFKNFLKGQNLDSFDFEWRHKNGSIRLGEARARLMVKEGKNTGMLAVVRDVTEMRNTEEILRASEEKYRMIFNNVNDEICYLDRHGRILDVNPRSKDIFGYDPKELIGKKFSEIGFFKGKSLTNNIKLLKQVVIDKKPLDLENHEILHKNGLKVIANIGVRPIVEDRKLKGIIIIVRDVTKQKKAEKETEEAHELLKKINFELENKVEQRTKEINNLLNQKDEFINQLGHDLKNPLTPLVNLLPIIEKNEKDKNMREMIKVINRNVGYMKSLVSNTIKLARLNSNDIKFNLEDTNLLDEFNKVIEFNKIILDEKNIHVVNNISDDICVFADRVRLEELLNNLLNNSIKYSNISGSITIDAKLDKDVVITSLKDNGIGMSIEESSQIFNEFYKADKSRHDFDSSGLGLSICKRIVDRHGGRIWVKSEGKGKGSTFYFTLKTISKDLHKPSIAQSKRINIIKYKGKEMLYLDYSNLKSEEYQKAVDEIINIVPSLGKKDLLVLTNVQGNYFTTDYIKNTKKAGEILKPYLKKNAIIGISRKQDIFLKAIKLFSDINMESFENIENAKDWLVE